MTLIKQEPKSLNDKQAEEQKFELYNNFRQLIRVSEELQNPESFQSALSIFLKTSVLAFVRILQKTRIQDGIIIDKLKKEI